jgi:PleD family two-component response regulator
MAAKDSVAVLAERIQQLTNKKAQEIFPFNIVISCGVAEYRLNENLDSIIKRADSMLYKSKLAGGNQVNVSSGA